MSNIINDNNFKEEVLENSGVVVVDFFATWCAPCKMLAPIVEELESELASVKFVKVDVDESPVVSMKYKISNIPTIKIFKNGEVVETKVGFTPKEALKEVIEEVL